MGYKKEFSRTLRQQAHDKLNQMKAFGQSKQQAKLDGTMDTKIFSKSTYNTYKKHINYYVDWLEKTHPECKTIKKAKKYVNEYLTMRDNQKPELSAYTIQLEAKALGKLYQIKQSDPEYFKPRPRKRIDIKRSRGEAVRDKHFSEANNWELVSFCKGTGLRRSELKDLKGNEVKRIDELFLRMEELENKPDITKKELQELNSIKDMIEYFPDNEYYIFVSNGKGGRPRYSPIIGKNKQQIIDRIKNTPVGKPVWEYVSTNADIHGYRSEYATILYKETARDIKDIPYDKVNQGTGKLYQSDVYICRKDEKGKKLDKKAMLKTSKALGHNRVCVIADHYVRNL